MMGMTVVATFMNLPEAQIAAGALASGGLHPLVMDQGWGSVVWIEQAALQGFRLAVPSEEAADAVAFFRALPPLRKPLARPRSPIAIARSNWWRVVAAILGLGLAPVFGWLAVGLRPKQYRRRGSVAFGGMLAVVAIVLIIATLFIVLEFLADVPRAVWIVSPLVVGVLILLLGSRRHAPPEV
jgi:hypothetical protein